MKIIKNTLFKLVFFIFTALMLMLSLPASASGLWINFGWGSYMGYSPYGGYYGYTPMMYAGPRYTRWVKMPAPSWWQYNRDKERCFTLLEQKKAAYLNSQGLSQEFASTQKNLILDNRFPVTSQQNETTLVHDKQTMEQTVLPAEQTEIKTETPSSSNTVPATTTPPTSDMSGPIKDPTPNNVDVSDNGSVVVVTY